MKFNPASRLYTTEKKVKLALSSEGFSLTNGQFLKEVEVTYETYGSLNSEGSNAVLICTPLTMDAHAAGWYSDEDKEPGWWDEMIGPGKAVDTGKFFVIASNILGGCRGTTGPASINPETGKPYGSLFPLISIQDLVAVQYLLVCSLGVSSLAAVIGGSMGGMQALQWSVAYPQFVRKCICIAAAHQLSPQALGFEIIGRKFVISDPHFNNGDYYETKQEPRRGLAFARMIGLLTYLSADSMKSKFGREKKGSFDPQKFETGYEVESYLNYNAHKFTDRFDANSYLHVTYAMDNFDLETLHGTLDKAFAQSSCEYLLIALSSDWLFLPQQSRELTQALLRQGKLVSLVELESPYGHDAFLLEVEGLSQVIQGCLFAEAQKGKISSEKIINPTPTGSQPFANNKAQEIPPETVPRVKFELGKQPQPQPQPNVTSPPASKKANSTSPSDSPFVHQLSTLMEPGSHILDIGCGGGQLIDSLYHLYQTTGFGIEIEFDRIVACLRKNVPVVQLDADKGLSLFGDKSFDYAILSLTLHMLRNPQGVLAEMLRVANKGIVVFPNFGKWEKRLKFLWRGKVPSYSHKGQRWWQDTPRRIFTFSDFTDLCHDEKIKVEKVLALSSKGQVMNPLLPGGVNFWAHTVVAKLAPMKEGF